MRELTAAAIAGGAALSAGGGPAAAPAAPPQPGRFVTGTVADGAARREYRLYVPASADPASAVPLIVFLHGCTQDPDDLARGTRMNELAERGRFLVLYPAQPVSANGLRCWNWFQPAHQGRGAGEPALIEAMTRAVMRERRVDPARVHVAGISAGGAMAMLVAAAYPERFASVASHSGIAVGSATTQGEAVLAMRGGAGDPGRLESRLRDALDGAAPPPLLLLHGTADAVVAPANADAAAAAWAAVAGARAGPPAHVPARDGGRAVRRTRYLRPDGTVAVEAVTIDGLGHAWSGGSPAGTYTDATGPAASELLVEFFGRHSRAGGGE